MKTNLVPGLVKFLSIGNVKKQWDEFRFADKQLNLQRQDPGIYIDNLAKALKKFIERHTEDDVKLDGVKMILNSYCEIIRFCIEFFDMSEGAFKKKLNKIKGKMKQMLKNKQTTLAQTTYDRLSRAIGGRREKPARDNFEKAKQKIIAELTKYEMYIKSELGVTFEPLKSLFDRINVFSRYINDNGSNILNGPQVFILFKNVHGFIDYLKNKLIETYRREIQGMEKKQKKVYDIYSKLPEITIELNKNFIRRQVQGILEPIVEQAVPAQAAEAAPAEAAEAAPRVPSGTPIKATANLALTTAIIQKVVDDICNEVEIQAPSLPPGGSLLGPVEASAAEGSLSGPSSLTGTSKPKKRKPEKKGSDEPPKKGEISRSITPDVLLSRVSGVSGVREDWNPTGPPII